MVRNLSNNITQNEEEVLRNLEKDLQNHSKAIEKSKQFGIQLPSNVHHLKKNVYLYFCNIARRKELSPLALKWMADFAENSPYEDVRQNYNNQAWVDQYRTLKRDYK
jgi:hypothetical protein